MPRKDLFHNAAVSALRKDGWKITHDPYILKLGDQPLYVDVGAEQPIGAERGGRKIAVEVKSFVGDSPLTDLQKALGQYRMYLFLIERTEPERLLYLAVTRGVYLSLLRMADVRELLERNEVRLVVLDVLTEEITQWLE